MNERTQTWPDPLIDEVRERRRLLFADCGNDLRKLLELVRRLQDEHPEKLVDRRRSKAAGRRS